MYSGLQLLGADGTNCSVTAASFAVLDMSRPIRSSSELVRQQSRASWIASTHSLGHLEPSKIGGRQQGGAECGGRPACSNLAVGVLAAGNAAAADEG